MSVQRVTSLNEIVLDEKDTFPRDEEFLKTLKSTNFTDPGQYGSVAWYTWRKDAVCLNTACHAWMSDFRAPASYFMNVVCWKRYHWAKKDRVNYLSEEFAYDFFDWMLDPKRTLWPEILQNLAVIYDKDNKRKPKAFIWLRPEEVPLVPLVHSLITGPRFVTEFGNAHASAEYVWKETGSMKAAIWAGHCYDYNGKLNPQSGHRGFRGSELAIPKCFLTRKFKVPQDTLSSGGKSTTYVNHLYENETVPFTPPREVEDYSKAFKELKAKVKKNG